MTTPHPLWQEALGHEATDKRLDILNRIGQVGSISQAARSAGVSYKAAWQAVETLSNLAGSPLLEKAVGGKGGGGAKLTPAGLQLLAAAQKLQSARAAVVAEIQEHSGTTLSQRGVSALGLRTSMRNTLPCTVSRLERDGGAVRVHLQLDNGQSLSSRITRESAQLLGLRHGLPVWALCKATAVDVTGAAPTDNLTDSNVLRGTVSRAPAGQRAGEVSVQLGPDLHLMGFAAAGHGLRKGASAFARVESSAVVIALSA